MHKGCSKHGLWDMNMFHVKGMQHACPLNLMCFTNACALLLIDRCQMGEHTLALQRLKMGHPCSHFALCSNPPFSTCTISYSESNAIVHRLDSNCRWCNHFWVHLDLSAHVRVCNLLGLYLVSKFLGDIFLCFRDACEKLHFLTREA